MIIIAMRDPDASNEFRVFGEPEPRIIDVDYGYADLHDAEEFAEWKESHLTEVAFLRKLGTPAAIEAADFLEQLVSEAEDSYQS